MSAIKYLAASSCSVKISGIRIKIPSNAKCTIVETTTVVAFLPFPPASSMESSNIPTLLKNPGHRTYYAYAVKFRVLQTKRTPLIRQSVDASFVS